MATYYRPPPLRTSANVAQQPEDTPLSHTYGPSQEVPDQSIYIFPVPPTIPSSPGGSSVFSAPSDFTEEFTISSVGRSRHSSISSQFTDRSRSHDGSRTQLSFVDEDAEAVFSPMVDMGSDPEVEVWEWTETEAGDDLSPTDASWCFEASGSSGTLPSRQYHLARHTDTSRTMSRHDYRSIRPQLPYMRSRTHSSLSAHSSDRYTPHPRTKVPLLSFFASILSLDLDDPALRLLQHSAPDSVLFPGQPGLLHNERVPSSTAHRSDAFEDESASSELDEPHGVLRLLSEDSATKSVREGLATIYDSPLPNPFMLPGWSSLTSLYRFVGDVWTNGGQAWRELGGSDVSRDAKS